MGAVYNGLCPELKGHQNNISSSKSKKKWLAYIQSFTASHAFSFALLGHGKAESTC
jgi:hypothetical protein